MVGMLEKNKERINIRCLQLHLYNSMNTVSVSVLQLYVSYIMYY